MKIRLSRHAEEQMIFRGFSMNELREGLQQGSKAVKNGTIVCTHKYYRIVYRMIDDMMYVITITIRWKP